MPLKRCQDDDQPGWKWGDSGKCYTYTRGNEESETEARKKAMAQAAAMGEFPGTGSDNRDAQPLAPIEFREASVTEVKFPQRLITVVAVPYEEPAIVEYRGELWEESFLRGAFDGIEKRPNRVRANRDHDKRRTVGKVNSWWPSRTEGLVSEVRIAQTQLGDETLALADEDILGVSVGFAARGRDQVFDRSTHSRRIKRAFVDHLAFTATPAYMNAMPIDVRHEEPLPNAADLPPLVTPALDEMRAWLQARKVR
jgi:phage head maturation protease